MSVIAVSPDLIEVNTLLLQPSQSFSSSSFGTSGEIRIYARPTSAIKSIQDVTSGSKYVDTMGITDDNDLLFMASEMYKTGAIDISAQIASYMQQVSSSNVDLEQRIKVAPVRFDAPYSFAEPEAGTYGETQAIDKSDWRNLQRRVINKCLIPDNLIENPISFNAYNNYNCLNFVSSSNFGTASAIVYPNFPDATGIRQYTPDNAFTLDFFIKPKAQIREKGHYRAGTILHISSSICISLISGSLLGVDQKPETYRLLLQLSQSADTPPSSIDASSIPLSYPNNLIFATDEVLKRDTWHRVTVRWAGATRSFGTGSIKIDNNISQFSTNSRTISTGLASDALILGNYFDSGDRVAKFFNVIASNQYGTLMDPVAGFTDPDSYKFEHPLNAEVHNISIFKRFLTDQELTQVNSLYLTSSFLGGPSFFLAPFFTSSIPSAVSTYFSPNVTSMQSTDSPVSYRMALGYHANYLNLQNFLVDFAQVRQARAVGMSEGQIISTAFDSRSGSIDDLLMLQQENRKRNFSIIPCDDGLFNPDFSILKRDETRFHYFKNVVLPGMISLDALAPPGTFANGGVFQEVTSYGTGSYSYDGRSTYLPWYQDVNYFTENENPDNSSNLPIIFSIPSMYYMTRIVPETFVITDSNVSGSGGMSFTLRDDGRGNLYRADARSQHAKWNRVGAIFYNHGIAVILSPHIPFFGKNSFEVSFKGEMRKTVATISIPAKPDIANYSYNPTYKEFPPTQLASEQAESFSYITGINLHDQNLNVVMRAKLAQSIQKREGDEITFRLRYDF